MPSVYHLQRATIGGGVERIGAITANKQESVTAVAGDKVDANTARKYLLLVNGGATDCFVNFNTTCTTANGILIKADGGHLEFDKIVPTTACSAITASGSTTLDILEM